MIERGQSGIQSAVMIENRFRTIYIERRAKLLSNTVETDIFAEQPPVAVMKRVHKEIVAAVVLRAESKLCGPEKLAVAAANDGWRVMHRAETQNA